MAFLNQKGDCGLGGSAIALTEKDVLGALSDPVLQRMDFWVDSIHIRGSAYTKIADLIEDEQILIVSGTDPDKAEYNPRSDTLTTQKAAAAADLFNRSRLIHECTHAIEDMDFATATWHTQEAAARIAQATYLLVSNPAPPIPPYYLKHHFSGAIALVKKFKLDTAPGVGTRLRFDDVLPLIRQMNSEPAYHRDSAQLGACDGISPKEKINLTLKAEEPIPIPDRVTAHEQNAPLSDSYLISLLQPRYAADDVAGFGARARKLEEVFRSASLAQALPLFPRLVVRRPGDKVSMYFHDHLSTPTRTKLLQIVQNRMAGK